MPDGTIVRARPVNERDPDDAWRDFGLYCDPRWAPIWPSDLIDWPDFGVPADAECAAEQIVAAYERARSGQHVEIGCIGGLGRTGTVLACMAILAGSEPANAVAWVRETYDARAVETPEQERWVEWFGGRRGSGRGTRDA
ncbi:MAG TPA: protein-tyrosine phosphatase family protein [Thermomicrobiales bacterium]|nr:protein-tyrosine phosphatase family protein [Thermomicrobiales bacterium]